MTHMQNTHHQTPSPDLDPDLKALFADPVDEPVDFGFTHRVMAQVEHQQRQARWMRLGVLTGACLLGGIVTLLLGGPLPIFDLAGQGLMGFVLGLLALGTALGGVGYACAQSA